MTTAAESEKANNVFESDEEKIISALVVEGLRNLYEDTDFLPIRQSLYNFENIIPLYDDEVGGDML